MKKKRSIILIIVALSFLLQGCNGNITNNTFSKSAFLFDTFITISIYENNEDILNNCIKKCEYYDNLFNETKPDSDVYKINHSNGKYIEVSSETLYLIRKAIEYSKISDGKYDITIEPVYSLWNFDDANTDCIPDKSSLSEALQHVNYQKIEIDPECSKIRLKDPKASITLGSIAKGYIADEIKQYLLSVKITSGIIDLGGNIVVIGKKPDSSNYLVGIKDPIKANENKSITGVSVSDMSIVTSGTYERFITVNGIQYHHILDTKTGYPVENKIMAVTILSPKSIDGDLLSTVCILLGKDNALSLINSIKDTECIIIDSNEKIYYSDNAKDYIIDK